MDLNPLRINSQCARSDDELFANIEGSMRRGYPEILEVQPPVDIPIAIVCSGPSVESQIEVIRQMRKDGFPIVAVRDAHDWLIAKGITPDFAFSVDPLPDSWHCFEQKNGKVHYILASQCDAAVFDHLAGEHITIWHLYMKAGQTKPAGRMLIGGASTSGLRAINVFHALGYRNFALFGLDSCLDQSSNLRVNGSKVKPGDPIIEVRLHPEGEVFFCNLSMAQQAQHFQDYYAMLPDATFKAYGHGLIASIIEQREKDAIELNRLKEAPIPDNGRISFIHSQGPEMASYRYRAAIPAGEMGASINDLTASTLIFSKIRSQELIQIGYAKARGQKVIVDFCDDHFKWTDYQEALRLADMATCPTEAMAQLIESVQSPYAKLPAIIPDPYEFPLLEPHCHGVNLLWFGHVVNREGLDRIRPELEGYPLRIVGNFEGAIPWSLATMEEEFHKADIVILPKTADYKSANRAVEALRQGCFVIAEPHPALMDIPGIYIGNIKEGIEWVKRQPLPEVSRRISLGQRYVTEKYSPAIVTAQWRSVIQSLTISDAAESTGKDGKMSMPELMPT